MGAQIPVWHGPDGTPFVELTQAEADAAAQAHYGEAVTLVQDEDVLDTWFSSALWPFSTLAGLKIRQSWPDIIRVMCWLQALTSFSLSGLRG